MSKDAKGDALSMNIFSTSNKGCKALTHSTAGFNIVKEFGELEDFWNSKFSNSRFSTAL